MKNRIEREKTIIVSKWEIRNHKRYNEMEHGIWTGATSYPNYKGCEVWMLNQKNGIKKNYIGI